MPLGPVSFSGLASGIDVKSIVAAILKAERQPVDQLTGKQTRLDARRSALQDFSSKLSALRTSLQDLAAPATISSRAATTSDSAVVTASASTSADTGAHTIEVLTTARAARVRGTTVASRYDPAVADGTITIQSGTRAAVTVEVSAAAGNNTLAAIQEQINAADAGVVASIVNDGSGDLLVLRAAATGTANALSISDSTNLGLADAGNALDAARDATFLLDGVSVTSGSNTVTTAIAGVTLQLVSAKPGTTIDVGVAADTARVKKSLRDFADAYNTVSEALRKQFSADPTTGRAGALAGDPLLRRAQELLQTAVSGGVAGLASTDLTTLGAIGIAIEGSSGTLKIDESKLDAALADRFDQVARLIGVAGRTSDSAVSFAGISSGTPAGTYAVGVTQAAERASVLGATAIRSGLQGDETLTVGLGTQSVDVSLLAGDDLSAVVNKLNSAFSSSGIGVRATAEAGRLRLTSIAYGNAAAISVVSSLADPGDGSTTGIGSVALTDKGVDIIGTLNGVAATGVGNALTAPPDTAAAGLSVLVFADASAVAARRGSFGTVTVTRGVGDTLARDLKAIVEPIGGLLANALSGIDDEARAIRDQIAEIELRLKDREVFLTLQFDRAERAIQSLQQQQAALGRSYSLF